MSTPSFLVLVAWKAWIQLDLEGWAQKPELGHSNWLMNRQRTQIQLIKVFHETFTKCQKIYSLGRDFFIGMAALSDQSCFLRCFQQFLLWVLCFLLYYRLVKTEDFSKLSKPLSKFLYLSLWSVHFKT